MSIALKKIKSFLWTTIKILRIIAIRTIKKKEKIKHKRLIIGDTSEIRRQSDGTLDDSYFHAIKKELKEKNIFFSEIRFSFTRPLDFLRKKDIQYVESYFSLFDIVRALFLKDKRIHLQTSLNRVSNNYEFKIYYLIFKRIFEQNNIEAIFLCQHYSTRYASLLAAKDKGIKVIEMQHGIIPYDHPGYIIPKKYRNKYVLPDTLITYGNFEKKLLSKESIWTKKELKPLGCPRYDFLADYSINSQEFKKTHQIPNNKKILFWATMTHDPIMERLNEHSINADAIFSEIKNKEEWFLIIKFHPGEDVNKSTKFYNKYKKKYKLNRCKILRFNEASTYDCVAIADAVIQKTSTVGMESLLMGVPVISLELKKSWDLGQFKDLSSGFIITKKQEIGESLDRLQTQAYKQLFRKERDQYCEYHFSYFGKSTKKVCQLIETNLIRGVKLK